MNNISNRLQSVYSLESLSMKDTIIHRLHPMVKLVVTIVYIICMASTGRYDLFLLTLCMFYPLIIMALAEIPFGVIFKRAAIALPFSLFAGISNIIFDRNVYMVMGSVIITNGVISFVVIMLRTYLCVAAVLILVAITPFAKITGQLKKMHMPDFLVNLVEMTYRYIGVLVVEADTMLTAYRLRSPKSKWPKLKDFGSFVGQLFLRSYNRAERIYQAMKCRGYGMADYSGQSEKLRSKDMIYLIICVTYSIGILVLKGVF